MTGCRRTWPPKSRVGRSSVTTRRVSSWGTAPTTPAHSRSTGGGTQVLDGLALANGINNSGEVVGYDVLDDFTHAAVWKKGRTVQLPQANAYGWGQAISDDGTVAGGNPQPGGTGIVNQAALWRNGRYLDLQPTGTCYGQASDIDDADTSVGYISPPGDCNGERPQAVVGRGPAGSRI